MNPETVGEERKKTARWHVQGPKGFTFVELLISVLIISFLGAVVYHVFAQGVRLWRRVSDTNPDMVAAIYLEQLTSELRNVLVYEGKTVTGDPQHVEFYALFPSNRESVKKISHTAEEPIFIRHAYEAEGAVIRTIYGDDSQGGQGESIKQRIGLDRILECRFSYYAGDVNPRDRWVNTWQKPCVPQAVKVLIQYRVAGAMRTLSRVVPLPLASGECVA